MGKLKTKRQSLEFNSRAGPGNSGNKHNQLQQQYLSNNIVESPRVINDQLRISTRARIPSLVHRAAAAANGTEQLSPKKSPLRESIRSNHHQVDTSSISAQKEARY